MKHKNQDFFVVAGFIRISRTLRRQNHQNFASFVIRVEICFVLFDYRFIKYDIE